VVWDAPEKTNFQEKTNFRRAARIERENQVTQTQRPADFSAKSNSKHNSQLEEER
jgi:hypothetical protein